MPDREIGGCDAQDRLHFVGGVGISSPANAQSAQEPAAVPVGVITAERKAVAKTLDFVGRVEAVQRVEMKARITGYFENGAFKEGELIKEGAPLYDIEKGLFHAAVKQAEGALERAKSAKVLTVVQLQRAEELLAKELRNGGGQRPGARRRINRRRAQFWKPKPIFKPRKSILAIPILLPRFLAKLAEPASQKAMWSGPIRVCSRLSSARIRCM